MPSTAPATPPSGAALTYPEEDRLGRDEFARSLAQAIFNLNAGDGFVLGLNGKWGSGKSTLLNFTIHHIDRLLDPKLPELIVIRFNPWWFSGQEQLLLQFFRQIEAVLGTESRSDQLNRIGTLIGSFSRLMTPLSFLPIPGVGATTNAIGKVTADLSNTFEEWSQMEARDLNALHDSIKEALQDQSARLLIVIDDIDRLRPDETRQMMQVIKSVGNFPNMIYLLAFDREVVARNLGDEEGVPGGYLEKIVQVQFDLPIPAQTSLRGMFFDGLRAILQDTDARFIDANHLGAAFSYGIGQLLKTPRDVSRLINTLRVTYPMVRNQVNASDFMTLEAIRTLHPRLYRFIVQHKALLTVEVSQSDAETIAERLRTTLLESGTGAVDDRVTDLTLLIALFPLCRKLLDDQLPIPELLNMAPARMAEISMFDRYLLADLGRRDVSVDELRAIAALAGDPVAYEQEVRVLLHSKDEAGFRQLYTFLTHLIEIYDAVPTSHIVEFVQITIDAAEELIKVQATESHTIGMEPSFLGLFEQSLSRVLYNVTDIDLRNQAIRDGFLKSQSTLLIAIIPGMMQAVRSSDMTGSFTTNEVVAEVTEEAVRRVLESMRTDAICVIPEFPRFLFTFLDREGHRKDVVDYVRQLMSTDKGFAVWIWGHLWKSYGWDPNRPNPDSDSWHWQIRMQELIDYTELKHIEIGDRCQRILSESPEWLSEQQRIGLEKVVREMANPTLLSWVEPL